MNTSISMPAFFLSIIFIYGCHHDHVANIPFNNVVNKKLGDSKSDDDSIWVTQFFTHAHEYCTNSGYLTFRLIKSNGGLAVECIQGE